MPKNTNKTKNKDKDKTNDSGTGLSFRWPAPGCPTITQGFHSNHYGIDISTPSGTKLVAIEGGKVTCAEMQSSYGGLVEIYHGGHWWSRYAHQKEFAVKKGDQVEKGQVIGYADNTGHSTGNHLHFEIIYDPKATPNTWHRPWAFYNRVDPRDYVSYNKERDAKIPKGGKAVNPDDETGTGAGLPVSPEKLYSSNNYEYLIDPNKKAKQTATQQLRKAVEDLYATVKGEYEKNIKDIEKNNKNFFANILNEIMKNLNVTVRTLSDNIALVKSSTMKSGSTGKKSAMPVVSALVEAPYFEVTIGGVKFGSSKKKKIPNYVKSITIEKTNGNVSEYTIQLIHQIRVGDNPNYIDSALSKEGYNKIQLKYGNANTGQVFSDNEALITSVTENFDFTNCNIIYNIKALSTSATAVASKRNYPEYTGKPSTKIKQLTWGDATSGLLNAFPGMRNKIQAESKNLIPTNDASVTIGAVQNVSPIEYISLLVSMMINETDRNKETASSMYVLTTEDSPSGNRFKITEVKTTNSQNAPFIYEVNVGYPDDNFVLDFQVNNNFAYSVIYESSKSIPKYDYSINGSGGINVSKIPSYYKNDDDTVGEKTLWSALTRYPMDATLIVRGLLRDSLLMQYVRINQYLYGAKRINSGMYIVLSQVDSIGNGVYTTALKLLRVAGDNEYISIDGRLKV